VFPQLDGHDERTYVGLPLRSVKLNEVDGSEGRPGMIEYSCEITSQEDWMFICMDILTTRSTRHPIGSRPQTPDPRPRTHSLTGKAGPMLP
jgi:hypothetical protein